MTRYFVAYRRIRGMPGIPNSVTYGNTVIDEHPVTWAARVNQSGDGERGGYLDQVVLEWFTTDVPDDLDEEFDLEIPMR